MEESDLLRERLQAITEKHRVQADIRQKKLELDQEKLKLQHLKKKALREQWLLQDATSHNATVSPQQQSLQADQQQTRVLQRNIYRIEKEVESLEREESMISTNESFILNRLKAVERRAEEIIKALTPLFAMEINVTKNVLTGESTVVSTADVPPQDFNQHAGVKVYDDGRKCVYALMSQEGSHEQVCMPELSANEVEQLLRSATEHRHINHQTHRRRQGHCHGNQQDERDDGQGGRLGNYRGRQADNRLHRNNVAEEDISRMNAQKKNRKDKADEWQSSCTPHRHHDGYNNIQEERSYQGHLPEGHHHGNNKREGPRNTNGLITQKEKNANYHANGAITHSSRTNGTRANGCPPLIPHDLEVVSARQPELCYTPANYIPLRDYVNVEEEELYCYTPLKCKVENNQSKLRYAGPAHSDRGPSPICCDDTPFTILNTMETNEPITAVFMGFQTTQDVSGRGQEYEGSLKAELIIIDDDDDDNRVNERNTQLGGDHGHPAENVAKGNVDAVKDGQVGPEISKNTPNLCCTIC
ncbi:uncharacterized protein LOC142988139 [Genypterus blacodes]|uniref:uncharacterized protein LOC142988139 n=1 Tax=Genypterus blacodes TaxID=154954 RepID=UPI003F775FB2